MLIDTRRDPPPPPEPGDPRRWHFDGWNWLAPLLIGLGLIVLSSVFPPVPAYILLLGGCVMMVRGFGRMLGDNVGLRDYHQ